MVYMVCVFFNIMFSDITSSKYIDFYVFMFKQWLINTDL